MKLKVPSGLAGLVFLAGILMELSLSGSVLWGELETRIYTSQSGNEPLGVDCPLMLTPGSSGTVTAVVTNTQDEAVSPVVVAEISRASGDLHVSQTLELAPHTSRTLHWTVDASDAIFSRLILVNIYQGQYRNLPSRQGACGILLIGLFGLGGPATFALLFLAGPVCILAGAGLWLKATMPLDDFARSLGQASLTLAVVSTAALFSSLPRWWGLILFLDFLTLLIMIVILTEFILFPRYARK